MSWERNVIKAICIGALAMMPVVAFAEENNEAKIEPKNNDDNIQSETNQTEKLSEDVSEAKASIDDTEGNIKDCIEDAESKEQAAVSAVSAGVKANTVTDETVIEASKSLDDVKKGETEQPDSSKAKESVSTEGTDSNIEGATDKEETLVKSVNTAEGEVQQEQVQENQAAKEEEKENLDNAQNESKEAEKENTVEDVSGKDQTAIQAAITETINPSAAEVESETKPENQETAATDTSTPTDQVNSAKANLEKAEEAAEKMDAAMQQAEAAVNGTEKTEEAEAVKGAEQIAADTKTAIEAAQKEYDDKQAAISQAKTEEEAKDTYDTSEQIAKDADELYNAAKEQYDAKKAEYDTALAELAAAQANYKAALTGAEEDLEKANADLQAAQDKADALKTAADNAAAALNNSLELKVQAMKHGSWPERDAVFEEIIKKYYLPVELGVKGNVSLNWTRFGNDEKNYCTIEYTDNDGNPKTVYYNYKMDPNDQNHLVIFEKTDEPIIDQEEVPEHYETKGTDDNTISYNAGEEMDTAVAEGKVVNVDGKMIAKDQENGSVIQGETDNTPVTEGAVISEDKLEKTVTKINESGIEKPYTFDAENNELTKTITDKVTITTYKLEADESDYVFDTKEAAEKAGADKVEDKLDENGELKINLETKDFYSAEGTYIPAFQATYNFDGCTTKKEGHSDENTAEEKVREIVESVIGKVKSILDTNGYFYNNAENTLTAEKQTDSREESFLWKHWTEYDDYFNLSGSITVTYTKIQEGKKKYSTWDDITDLFHHNEKEKKAVDELTNEVEGQGGRFIDFKPIDGKSKTAEYTYLQGASCKTDALYDSEKDAREAIQQVANEAASKADVTNAKKVANSIYNSIQEDWHFDKNKFTNSVVGVADSIGNVKTTSTTKYAYQSSYYEKLGEETKDVVTATTTWHATEMEHVDRKNATTKMVPQGNDNYYLQKYLFEEKLWVEEAQKEQDAYEEISKKAKEASDSVEAAQKKINELMSKIEKLKSVSASYKTLEITTLEGQLTTAELDLDAAKKNLDDLNNKRDDAKDAYDAIVKTIREGAGDQGSESGQSGAGSQGSGSSQSGTESQESESGQSGTESQESESSQSGTESQGSGSSQISPSSTESQNSEESKANSNNQGNKEDQINAGSQVGQDSQIGQKDNDNNIVMAREAVQPLPVVDTDQANTASVPQSEQRERDAAQQNAENSSVAQLSSTPQANRTVDQNSTVNIEDQAVPLAADVETTDQAQEKASQDDTAKLDKAVNEDENVSAADQTTTIEDEEVPLAASKQEKGNGLWAWLLGVAVAVTGEEAYRRNKKKQKTQDNAR